MESRTPVQNHSLVGGSPGASRMADLRPESCWQQKRGIILTSTAQTDYISSSPTRSKLDVIFSVSRQLVFSEGATSQIKISQFQDQIWNPHALGVPTRPLAALSDHPSCRPIREKLAGSVENQFSGWGNQQPRRKPSLRPWADAAQKRGIILKRRLDLIHLGESYGSSKSP
jgi:hypothetical protein